MFPLGFSVGMPGEAASKIVIFICGRAPMPAVEVDQDLAPSRNRRR